MSVKFSEDVVPLTDLKVNPGRVVRQAPEAHRPVLLTSRDRGVAVLQSVADFERERVLRGFEDQLHDAPTTVPGRPPAATP